MRESLVFSVFVASPQKFTEEGMSSTEMGAFAELDALFFLNHSMRLLWFLFISEGDFFRNLTIGAGIGFGFRISDDSLVSRENTKVPTVREKVKDFFWHAITLQSSKHWVANKELSSLLEAIVRVLKQGAR